MRANIILTQKDFSPAVAGLEMTSNFMKKVIKKNKIKKANKRVRTEIKQAVEKMPGLIFEHVQLETTEPEQKITVKDLYPQKDFQTVEHEPQKKNLPDYAAMNKRRGLLWLTVIIMASVVFGMWGLNMFANLRDVRGGWIKPTPGIIDTAKDEWAKAMGANEAAISTTTEQAEKITDFESIKNEIKNNLIGILSTLSTSTTSSTNIQNYGQASTTTSSTN